MSFDYHRKGEIEGGQPTYKDLILGRVWTTSGNLVTPRTFLDTFKSVRFCSGAKADILPVTVFQLVSLSFTLLMSKASRLVKLPIAIGTGPRKFEFVRFKEVTLMWCASHPTPAQECLHGSVPGIQLGKLVCQSCAT
jgi:hypothetical protein